MFDTTDTDLVLYMAGCTLARKPGKNNWVEEDAVNGLPEYICRIARAINRDDPSKSISQVIAIAVSRVKVWARGGGGVTAKTSAKAAKAVAEWEKKKAAAKLDNKKVKLAKEHDIFLNLANSYNIDDIRRQYTSTYSNSSGNYRWIREMWSDFLIVSVESEGDSMKFIKVPYTVDKEGKAEFGEESEVKQAFVDLSHEALQTRLTDAQLEKAAMIPCTVKDNRSIVDAITLSRKNSDELAALVAFSSNKPHLSALINLSR